MPFRSLDPQTADAVLLEATSPVVLFKHSPACGTSLWAAREVRAFATAHPGTPVYVVDVLAQRPLSQHLAERLGVAHASPQVVVLRAGRAHWVASHLGVTTEAIGRALAA